MKETHKKKTSYLPIAIGCFALGFAAMIAFDWMWDATSTNEACMACHVHKETDEAWKKSVHSGNNSTGVITDCAACHLPPKGTWKHFTAKTKIGMKDIWAYLTKDSADFNWEAKKELSHAQKIVYNESCMQCHTNLFPVGVSDDAVKAHLYFEENQEKLNLQCISCHLDAGHYMPGYKHGKTEGPMALDTTIRYDAATKITAFENFTETVPGTPVAISMIAIPGGKFLMGSPKKEPFRQDDEGPQREVQITRFFMGEMEVTWDQYWAFYNETRSEGRTPPSKIYANNSRPDVDAVSGPTPPYGYPDQGWGTGSRPAITMSHYAAETFCQWLTLKTGKKYRLPTEAEWEYAARGGTDGAYFFEGSPKKYTNEGFMKRIFGIDTTMINGYVVYMNNSMGKTQEPQKMAANPFGLRNMLGNALEHCADKYNAEAYNKWADGVKDPICTEGEEYVVRGGCYADDARLLRCAARGHTDTEAWLKTDPQNPKSIWWYSDIKAIGFRVVCEVPDSIR